MKPYSRRVFPTRWIASASALASITFAMLALVGCGGGGFSSTAPPAPVIPPGPTLTLRVLLDNGIPPTPVPGVQLAASEAGVARSLSGITDSHGVVTLTFPHSGLYRITVSGPGLLDVPTVTVPVTEHSTGLEIHVSPVPAPSTVPVGSNTTVSDPTRNNPNAAGLQIAHVTFPTGAANLPLQVLVASTSPVAEDAWIANQSVGAPSQAPLTPSVVVRLVGPNAIANVSPDATVSVPSVLHPSAALQRTPVTVQLGTTPDNIGAATVQGTLQADATALVNMRASLDSLTAAGLIGGITRDSAFIQIIFRVEAPQADVPVGSISPGAPVTNAAQVFTNCGRSTPLTATLLEPVQAAIAATVDGAPAPALAYFVRTALGIASNVNALVSIDIPANLQLSDVAIQLPEQFAVSLDVPIGGQIYHLAATGSWNDWEFDLSYLSCPVTGATR